MEVGLDIKNPGSAMTACVAIWLTDPTGGFMAAPVHAHTANLPAGLDYSNPNLLVFTLPNLPSGTYAWHAAIMEPPTHSVIVEDTTRWVFTSTKATVEDMPGSMKETAVSISISE